MFIMLAALFHQG